MRAPKSTQEPSESSNDRDFLTGQVLIAMPNLGDPRFERAVVFLCAHDDEHAMGVIINKPLADVEIADLLEQLEIDFDDAKAEPVFFGGPVQTERGVVLHTLDYQTDATIALGRDVGITASRDVLVDIGGNAPQRPAPRKYLLAIGHAGWGPGQLEQEIAMNAWAHCDPDEAILFDGAVRPTWQDALSKLGVTGAMFSPEWAEGRDKDTPLN